MSEAREKYDFWVVMNHAWNIDDVINYVTELEQQLSELKESQKQKQITRLCNRLDKAEQQNKQMISAIKNILNQTCREDIWKIAEETLTDIIK